MNDLSQISPGQPPRKSPKGAGSGVMMTYVFLSSPMDFTERELAEALEEAVPFPCRVRSSVPADADKTTVTGMLTATTGAGREITLAIGALDFHFPLTKWPVILRRASTWPRAKAAVDRHKAHIVIAAMYGETDVAGRWQAAQLSALMAAIFAELPTAQAVWYCPGDALREPGAWAAAVRKHLNEGAIPYFDMVGFDAGCQKGRDGRDYRYMTSIGLAPLVGAEICFPHTPLHQMDVAGAVLGAGSLLVLEGAVFSNGDTIGEDPDGQPYRLRLLPAGPDPTEQPATWIILHRETVFDVEAAFRARRGD